MNGITDAHIVWPAYKNVRVYYPIRTILKCIRQLLHVLEL